MAGRVPSGAVGFLVGELDETIQMSRAAILQEGIREHRAERWREGERKACGHAVAVPALEHLKQRQIRLRDRFVEPALLEKPGMLRMPHEREVGMEDEGKVAAHDEDWSSPSTQVAGMRSLQRGILRMSGHFAVVGGMPREAQIRGALFLAVRRGGSGGELVIAIGGAQIDN
jgi:hypothetical protein